MRLLFNNEHQSERRKALRPRRSSKPALDRGANHVPRMKKNFKEEDIQEMNQVEEI